MLDTLCVRGVSMAFGLVLLAGACRGGAETKSIWAAAVGAAARSAPDARIVVLDMASGHVLAASRLGEAARTLAAPGSTLKPLALYGLVASGRWTPSRRIACNRSLRFGGRSLACSHPQSNPMDARLALAWSCNTYFAAVAQTLGPGELRALLAPTGLLGQTGLSPNEATATFRDPHTPDETSLALLGVDGIRVTPLELASAYRWLGLQLDAHPDSAAAQVVQAGLTDSASFGIAASASLSGVSVAGKTGTANLGGGTPTHGWFAGLVPATHSQVVVVVYLPTGHGADAARIAGEVLAHSPLRRERP